MPAVPFRQMYVRGTDAVLRSSAGTTVVGPGVQAYVPTRSGVVFARDGNVFALADGGSPMEIGPVGAHGVLLQVDPTLRYVLWSLEATDGFVARTLVWDVVDGRFVLDEPLDWSPRPIGPDWVRDFGDARIRLVHTAPEGIWTFGTAWGSDVVLPSGRALDADGGPGRRASDGVGGWSPGLRWRAAPAERGRPWRVVDAATGRDVTPSNLVVSGPRAPQWWRWLGNDTFGVLSSSGSWRHTTVTASECRVGGRCRVALRYVLTARDGGLGSSSETG